MSRTLPGLALLCAALLCCAATFAAAPAEKPWRTPTPSDWNGVWSSYRGPAAKPIPAPSIVPTPEYAPFLAAARQAVADRKEIGHGARCLPSGTPGVNNLTYPAEVFVQPGKQILIVYEYGGPRWIRLNGKHPDYVEPSYRGDSVGHWEGDTLVVDTIGISTRTVLNEGARHSKQLHVIERFREIQPGIIEVKMWMEDPRAFKQPVEWSALWRKTPDEQILEHVCENNVEANEIKNTFDAFDIIPEPPQD